MMATKRIEIGPAGRRVARNLAEVRISRRLSQPDLARLMERIGRPMAAPVVSKTEQLDRRVDVDDLIALAVALDVTPNRLLLTAGAGEDELIELTPKVRIRPLTAWLWARGKKPFDHGSPPGRPYLMSDGEREADFSWENRPDERPRARFGQSVLSGHPDVMRDLLDVVLRARERGVPADELVASIEAMHWREGIPPVADASKEYAPPQQPVVAAIVTSAKGVLVGRRNDGEPPWTFIAGEVEPGERPEDAAVREVKEETGCEIRTGEEIGRRVHPKTGRAMIYLAAQPERSTRLVVGDEAELAEVKWASLTEVEERMPDIFGPVREYLDRTLGGGAR